METFETIAVSAMAPDVDAPCWYCEEEQSAQAETKDDADPDTPQQEEEENVPENRVQNDSSLLGAALGAKPDWNIMCPIGNCSVQVVPAAHHLIPGNASLKRAAGLRKFMFKNTSHGFDSDIGYDVNSAGNGVWLPGNYGVRAGRDHYSKNWGAQETETPGFKNHYAGKAMEVAGDHFHDAHPAYSANVLQTLIQIAVRLEQKLETAPDQCPICDNPLANKKRPPLRARRASEACIRPAQNTAQNFGGVKER